MCFFLQALLLRNLLFFWQIKDVLEEWVDLFFQVISTDAFFSLTQSEIQKFDVDLALKFGSKLYFHRPYHKIHGIIHKSKKSICTIDSEFDRKLFCKERKQLV